MKKLLNGVVMAAAAFGMVMPATGQGLGPSPYNSSEDSPFSDSCFEYFHFEDFEDGVLNVPGVAASTGHAFGPGATTDSVDGDDGIIDGCGRDGHSYLANSASQGIVFDFDAKQLGSYPTHVGIVWTDAGREDADIVFEAYDANGGVIETVVAPGVSDDTVFCTTEEDTFLGVISAAGVASIHIWNEGGTSIPGTFGMELDHLQYGFMSSNAACPGDSNGDDQIDQADLDNVIADWGTTGRMHGGDVSGPCLGPQDGIVDVIDLIAVILGWGSCS